VQDDYTSNYDLKTVPFSLLTMTAAYVVPKEEVEKWGLIKPSNGTAFADRWLPNRR
jgi:hypothetical protein